MIWAFTKGWLLPLLLMFFCIAAHAASSHDQELVAKIKDKPMTFFIASGDENACGPGCNEWIAAEGNIDFEAGNRFRRFLEESGRRNLPIFFNSPGGSVLQAVIIGSTMRQQRMRAGVAKTTQVRCRATQSMDETCRKLTQSGLEYKAQLIAAGARCASACVWALLGASVREVSNTAELGIHSGQPVWTSSAPIRGAPPNREATRERLRKYALEMGVDPTLIDAAAKIGADQIHWLTRAEIEKFGIETRDFNETSWAPLQETTLIFSVSKSWSRSEPGMAERTTVLRIRCAGPSEYLLVYESELPLAGGVAPAEVRLDVGNDSVPLGAPVALARGRVFYSRVPVDVIERAATQPKLQVVDPSGVPSKFAISTVGLSQALAQLRARCSTATVTP